MITRRPPKAGSRRDALNEGRWEVCIVRAGRVGLAFRPGGGEESWDRAERSSQEWTGANSPLGLVASGSWRTAYACSIAPKTHRAPAAR